MYKGSIKEVPKCIIFAYRSTIRDHDDLFELVPAVGEKVGEANPGLKCAQPDYSFVAYPSGYSDADAEIEVCQAVTSFGRSADGVEFRELPGTKVASVLHKGSYMRLGEAHAFLAKWMAENGYVASGAPRESYIDGVWNKESEDDWLTELQIPVTR